MRKFVREAIIACGLMALATGAPVAARKSTNEALRTVDALIACADQKETSQRLACYDGRVAELKAARQKDANLFNSRDVRVPFAEIKSTIVSVAPLEQGSFLFVLADHSVWRTNDIVMIDPEVGNKVRVFQGALGSLQAEIGGNRSIRVRRLQ